MPLDIPMPWLQPANTVGALSAGGSAGAAAAHIAASRDEETNRLAYESNALNQRTKIEAAHLDQAAQMQQMEMQMRKEILDQNRLRDQQRLQISDAYHQAQLGLARGRLEEQQAVADAKAKDAAMRFDMEQKFGAAVAGGASVMDAYKQFPVPSGVVNAFTRAKTAGMPGDKNVIREGKYPIVSINPVTGESKEVYTPKTPAGISAADKEDLKDLRKERDDIAKKLNDPIVQLVGKPKPEDVAKDQQRLYQINKRIDEIKRPPSAGKKSKVDRAHEISADHPDWTKEQVIKAVNDEMQ